MYRAMVVLSLFALLTAGCTQEQERQAREAVEEATREAGEAAGQATEAVGQLGEPEVQITSPTEGETVSAPVTLQVEVSGFDLVPADGDTSGETGHLHAFVDREPTPPGEPIPTGQDDIIHFAQTSLQLEDLEPGEHRVTVVAGDGTHMPFEAAASDDVTFTVE
ncbi:MAG TPA: DUF4399 domain-containing protein [Egibacteraceae bacterium]|nr:DUF4399 domain-containing protein [Egibacteraceae bacterium]